MPWKETPPVVLTDESTVIIRYPNLSGAIVEVRKSIGTLFLASSTVYTAHCSGCLDEKSAETVLTMTRKWAQTHSETCRALPQPEPTDH
jgi:hypothetical protein